jgi:hypothetical protein
MSFGGRSYGIYPRCNVNYVAVNRKIPFAAEVNREYSGEITTFSNRSASVILNISQGIAGRPN